MKSHRIAIKISKKPKCEKTKKTSSNLSLFNCWEQSFSKSDRMKQKPTFSQSLNVVVLVVFFSYWSSFTSCQKNQNQKTKKDNQHFNYVQSLQKPVAFIYNRSSCFSFISMSTVSCTVNMTFFFVLVFCFFFFLLISMSVCQICGESNLFFFFPKKKFIYRSLCSSLFFFFFQIYLRLSSKKILV